MNVTPKSLPSFTLLSVIIALFSTHGFTRTDSSCSKFVLLSHVLTFSRLGNYKLPTKCDQAL